MPVVGSQTGAFVSGANARLKVGAKILAYATDLSYDIQMNIIPIEAIGSYEVRRYEPISYSVSGSFTVMRYTSYMQPENSNPDGKGNGAIQVGGETSMGRQLDPGSVLSSEPFDIEITQSKAGEADTTDTATVTLNSFFKLYGCRVTSRSASLNKRGVLMDTYRFVAILAGDTDDGSNPPTTSGSQIVDLST